MGVFKGKSSNYVNGGIFHCYVWLLEGSIGGTTPLFLQDYFLIWTLRTVDQKYGDNRDNQSSDLDMTNKWPDIEPTIKNNPTTGDILSPTSMNPATAWCWSARELWKPLGVKNVPWLRRFFPVKRCIFGWRDAKEGVNTMSNASQCICSITYGSNQLQQHTQTKLVGGLEHVLWLSIQLGISSSQLTNSLTPSFFRGVETQPPTRINQVIINYH